MPKVVDHDGRRVALADALMRLIERDGAEAVSMRAVAAEAGWSTGVLAHYFADKDALLTYAFELVWERGAARADRRAAAGRDPAATLRALLSELLPLDPERRREARLWFAFLERARTGPAMADVVRRRYDLWSERLEGALLTAGHEPDDAAALALELMALVDGLTIQALTGPRRLGPTAQERALDAALTRRPPPPGSAVP